MRCIFLVPRLYSRSRVHACRITVDHYPFINVAIHWGGELNMSKKESRSSLHTVTIGDCGYCGKTIHTDKNKALPLECQKCSELYHVSCLKGERPSVLLGDQLWLFRCAFCSPLGQETCTRPNLQWWGTQKYLWCHSSARSEEVRNRIPCDLGMTRTKLPLWHGSVDDKWLQGISSSNIILILLIADRICIWGITPRNHQNLIYYFGEIKVMTQYFSPSMWSFCTSSDHNVAM